MTGRRVLFATSELQPLVKTGGLADVSFSLPVALRARGLDVRVILPAYREALARVPDARAIARLALPLGTVRILEAKVAPQGLPVWLVEHPGYFDRDGTPYSGPDGDWPDNAQRFALFSEAIAAVAQDRAGLDWRACVLHANDWQTGLAVALLHLQRPRPALAFTIHNLAYRGLFPAHEFSRLALPQALWTHEGVEFHGRLAFIKGGLAYADCITAVSPTYAREIQTEAYGHGLDGLLRHRAERLHGILNGVDVEAWDPERDPHLAQPYSASTLGRKRANKEALQDELGLERSAAPLFGLVGRLVEQKGIDLVLGALDALLGSGGQLVVLGLGERRFEAALQEAAARHPRRLALRLALDERLAHRIEAGADFFLMPSRFEPCGLNQMYSLRYGTPPIVRATGGLADTVTHWRNGIVFEHADVAGMRWAIGEAGKLYADGGAYRAAQLDGMRRDFSWSRAAQRYEQLYEGAIAALPASA